MGNVRKEADQHHRVLRPLPRKENISFQRKGVKLGGSKDKGEKKVKEIERLVNTKKEPRLLRKDLREGGNR